MQVFNYDSQLQKPLEAGNVPDKTNIGQILHVNFGAPIDWVCSSGLGLYRLSCFNVIPVRQSKNKKYILAAARGGHTMTVQVLMANGAKIDAKDGVSWTVPFNFVLCPLAIMSLAFSL